jgi:spoIIIJ-associated protein
MPSVEITAKSVPDATLAAAEKLGVSPESVTVTVLEEIKGLFGKSSVRVLAESAEVKTVAPAPVAAPVAAAAPVAEAPVEEAPVAEAPAPRERGGRRPRRSEEPRAEAPAAEVAADAPSDAPRAETEEAEIVASQADAEQLLALVRELISAAGLEVETRLDGINGRYVTIAFDGNDSSYLVGKHGEVINAFQYLVNVIGGRRFNNGVRANLDANDYRRRREEALTAHAVKIAEQVKERGEEALLPTMPAFERRIIHKAMQSVAGVSTYSEGEEPNRRVVIAPGS